MEEFNGSFKDWWDALCSSYNSEELNIAAITCWAIWNDRNNKRMGKPIPNHDIKKDWVLKYYEQFLQSSAKRGRKSQYASGAPNSPTNKWQPPPRVLLN